MGAAVIASGRMAKGEPKPSGLYEAQKCRCVLRRMSFTTRSAFALGFMDLGLIFVPSSLRRDLNPP